jgi:hypothetical protein
MGLGGFGEMLPYYENKVYIDHSRQMGSVCVSHWLRIQKEKMQIDMMNDAAEMLEASGIKM